MKILAIKSNATNKNGEAYKSKFTGEPTPQIIIELDNGQKISGFEPNSNKEIWSLQAGDEFPSNYEIYQKGQYFNFKKKKEGGNTDLHIKLNTIQGMVEKLYSMVDRIYKYNFPEEKPLEELAKEIRGEEEALPF